MTNSLKYFGIAAVGALIALTAFGFYYTAHANPSRMQAPVSCSTQGPSATSLATSSVTYLQVTATTTITCNMGTAGAGTEIFDSAILAMQFHASSSPMSILNWYYEYSTDGQDWYPESEFTSANATTSITTALRKTYYWNQQATTTYKGVDNGLATSSRGMKEVPIPVSAKYVRVNFTLNPGSANGAIWAQIIGKAENLSR